MRQGFDADELLVGLLRNIGTIIGITRGIIYVICV